MKIAISANENNGLESAVSPHFGRCPYFVIVDIQDSEVRGVETITNPYYGNHQPGEVPSFIHQQGAEVMITGGMGGRAIQFFEEYGICPATGAMGTARQALAQYQRGELSSDAACRESIEHGHGEGH